MDDGAALQSRRSLAGVTTDSHVIHPVFFPGGDIGRLAVSGTVNDLAMMGATDVLALTCAVIIEEGFRRADLVRIQQSIRAGVRGGRRHDRDRRHEGDGEGRARRHRPQHDGRGDDRSRGARFRACGRGTVLIVTGTIGDHGMAVMARRHSLALDGELRSDVAPLNGLIRAALASARRASIVAMKDPTRGGLASALHEMADKSHVGIMLDEMALPVTAAGARGR